MKKIEKILKIIVICLLVNGLFKMSREYISNNHKIHELKLEIAQEENTKNLLIDKEKGLQSRYENLENPEEIEKIAREVLNLQKDGEEVYRVIK